MTIETTNPIKIISQSYFLNEKKKRKGKLIRTIIIASTREALSKINSVICHPYNYHKKLNENFPKVRLE